MFGLTCKLILAALYFVKISHVIGTETAPENGIETASEINIARNPENINETAPEIDIETNLGTGNESKNEISIEPSTGMSIEKPPVRDCPFLPELENGHYDILPDNRVQVVCDPDYDLIGLGKSKLRCLRGKWIPKKQYQCRRAQNVCPELEEVENARMLYDGRRIGKTVFYHCDPGYYMMGDKTRSCTEARYWSGISPKCYPNIVEPKDMYTMLEHHLTPNKTEGHAMYGRILGPEVFKSGLELFFVIDRSSSIDPVDLNYAKNFVKKLVRIFKGNENRINGTRICVITFGTKVTVDIPLDNAIFNNVNVTLKQIDLIQGEGGGTAMGPALATVFFYIGKLRDGAKRALFLVTDGEPNIGEEEPEDHAKELKELGFEIYCIGVGKDIGRERLTKIATEPDLNHVFMLENFRSFDDVLKLIQNPLTTPAPPPPPGPEACGFLGDSDMEASYDKEKKSYPWLAAVYVFIHDKIRFCSGVLVNNQWVLTSAICIQPHKHPINDLEVTIVLGTSDLQKKGLNFFAIEKRISPLHVPDMLPELRLALLKLDRKIPLNTRYRPICLTKPKVKGEVHQIDLAKNLIIEGWGSQVNQKIDKSLSLTGSYVSPISSRVRANVFNPEKECDNYMKRRYRHEKNKFEVKQITEKFNCVGNRDEDLKISRIKKPTVCAGNFGSPIIMKDEKDNRYYLLGIQSSEFGCSDFKSLYLAVPFYVNWIDRETVKNETDHEE